VLLECPFFVEFIKEQCALKGKFFCFVLTQSLFQDKLKNKWQKVEGEALEK